MWLSLTQVPDYNETLFSIKYNLLFPDKYFISLHKSELVYLKSGRPFIDLPTAQVYCVAIFFTCWHPSHITISLLL